MYDCCDVFDCIIECAFLEVLGSVLKRMSQSNVRTVSTSGTTTYWNFNDNVTSFFLNVSKSAFPFSLLRTTPTTENSRCRRYQTAHAPMYPFAPVTRTLLYGAIAGIMNRNGVKSSVIVWWRVETYQAILYLVLHVRTLMLSSYIT